MAAEARRAALSTEEEKAQIEALGGWDKLMETLKQRLEEQKERHAGRQQVDRHRRHVARSAPTATTPRASASVGRVGNRSAVKVWDEREFRNLDDDVELGTRNIKIALRKLRRFAREGAADQLDLDGTIDAHGAQCGAARPEFMPGAAQRVKVLLFLDVGGSMDAHVRCARSFSPRRAASSSISSISTSTTSSTSACGRTTGAATASASPTLEVLRTYRPDYQLIFVGDATMSPYEIMQPGGSIEHWNDEPGALWMQRSRSLAASRVAESRAEHRWEYTPSMRITRQLLGDRMFPLTLGGLDQAIKALH